MAQGYDRGDLNASYARRTAGDAASGPPIDGVDTTGKTTIMSNWGVQGKFPWLDYYATLQDERNTPLQRPAQTKMLPRNYMPTGAYNVASNVYTPYIHGMPWAPNPPHRTKQVSRFGGEQPNQMGTQELQSLQTAMRNYPALLAQARAYFFGRGSSS